MLVETLMVSVKVAAMDACRWDGGVIVKIRGIMS
jgi:hypothetical protein